MCSISAAKLSGGGAASVKISASTGMNDSGPARRPQANAIIEQKDNATMVAPMAAPDSRSRPTRKALSRPASAPVPTRRQVRAGATGRSARLAQMAPVAADSAAHLPSASVTPISTNAMPRATAAPLSTCEGTRMNSRGMCIRSIVAQRTGARIGGSDSRSPPAMTTSRLRLLPALAFAFAASAVHAQDAGDDDKQALRAVSDAYGIVELWPRMAPKIARDSLPRLREAAFADLATDMAADPLADPGAR